MPSTLLSLPLELRLQIYESALILPTPIIICQRPSDSNGILPPKPSYKSCIEPPLLRVCRQIRSEALKLFYERNVFFSALRDPLLHFLESIGDLKRGWLRCARGFSATRYFDWGWSATLVRELERDFETAKLGLRKGVLQVPCGIEGWEGWVFWVGNGEKGKVWGSRVGDVLGMRDGAWFEIEEGEDGKVTARRV